MSFCPDFFNYSDMTLKKIISKDGTLAVFFFLENDNLTVDLISLLLVLSLCFCLEFKEKLCFL